MEVGRLEVACYQSMTRGPPALAGADQELSGVSVPVPTILWNSGSSGTW